VSCDNIVLRHAIYLGLDLVDRIVELNDVFLCLRGVWFTASFLGGSVELSVFVVFVQLEQFVVVRVALGEESLELGVCFLLLRAMSAALCELPGKTTLVVTPSLHLLDFFLDNWSEELFDIGWDVIWIKSLLDTVCVEDVGSSDIESGCTISLRVDDLHTGVHDVVLII